MAAVSVRNRVFPKVTGIKLCAKAISISLTEKSPSGPMRIVTSEFGFNSCFKDFLSVSSQCAINKSPEKSCCRNF